MMHPRHIAWTTEKEIALAKGWLAISENSKHGNARNEHGFWCEVLQYIESKTKQLSGRTYDMVCEKWKTVRPSVIRFCEVYNNVMCMAQESFNDSAKWQEIALLKFDTESKGGSKKHKSSGSSSFNTESGDASINLNINVGDNDEDEVQVIRRTMGRDKARAVKKNKGSKASGSLTMNDDELTRLMVTEMTTHETE
nr:hypothetical protein [Tanacetum cinerariifolium]